MGVVVGKQKIQRTTTTETQTSGLLTHDEAPRLLAGALNILRQLGQDKLKPQHPRILVDAVQSYDSVLEKVERWSEVENRILEMSKK